MKVCVGLLIVLAACAGPGQEVAHRGATAESMTGADTGAPAAKDASGNDLTAGRAIAAAEIFGVITNPDAVLCFAGRHLEPGEVVLMFEDGSEPVATLESTGQPCAAEHADRQMDVKLEYRTRLKGDNGIEKIETIAIGLAEGCILNREEGPGHAGDLPRNCNRTGADRGTLGVTGVDLDGDGVHEVFASCATGEGLHLTVWSGPVAASKRLWHSYYYLGYDTEPTCSEAEWTDESVDGE
ncbi:MAG: hypothetical protein A2341_06045 [Deltaproteobacteria bacterium RIFOXYB12_FULL_58_9]|nr:MAG: hypothetical protein A2341_06045 [Deltaproteobacteria bacterium RIFOXYB12_FULL_58_9]